MDSMREAKIKKLVELFDRWGINCWNVKETANYILDELESVEIEQFEREHEMELEERERSGRAD